MEDKPMLNVKTICAKTLTLCLFITATQAFSIGNLPKPCEKRSMDCKCAKGISQQQCAKKGGGIQIFDKKKNICRCLIDA